MLHLPDGIDVVGPVQAEVFVLWLNGERIELTGPCGSAPWLIELGETDHPVDVVARIVADVVGPPVLVHSTSWRRERGAIVLSFVVVIDKALVGAMESAPIDRAELAASPLGRHRCPAIDRPSTGRRAWAAPSGVAHP